MNLFQNIRFERDLHRGAREIGGFTVNRSRSRIRRAIVWVLVLGRTHYT